MKKKMVNAEKLIEECEGISDTDIEEIQLRADRNVTKCLKEERWKSRTTWIIGLKEK